MTNVSIIDGIGSGYLAQVDNSGCVWVNVRAGSISIEAGDIEIGAVELKDQISTNRATIAGSRLWTDVLGSIAITNVVPISGTVNTSVWAGVGSVLVSNIVESSGTSNVLGSVAVTTGYLTGSVDVVTLPAIEGSVAITSGYLTGSVDVVTMPSILGSIAVSSGYVLTSGNIVNTGSVAITNTVPITNVLDEEGRRSPDYSFSGALLTTSGLTTNILIPTAGSKLLLKSYTISSDVANLVILKFSGDTTIPIAGFFIPASGTIIQNFIGCEPSGGANCPLSAGIGTNGNIYISVFARNVP